MLCLAKSADGDEDARNRNKEIERMVRTQKRQARKDVKMLLLGKFFNTTLLDSPHKIGTADSGKSTFAKQMKLLHADGFSETERREFLPHVYFQIVSAMKILLECALADRCGLNPEVAVYLMFSSGVTVSTRLLRRPRTLFGSLRTQVQIQSWMIGVTPQVYASCQSFGKFQR